ncbi:uncharacterized protein LOC129595692 [Paramacrobiotus metropolitanus]|uniref:uncharacterized protein LOC129595692 n=1 Tax=Paramacrobiotus metropolitanus TaxID=2943436 RepID=UPI002445CA1E|nr:uncharacterized protein LOC129595692 [Paramacrobiotus metropolitanus]
MDALLANIPENVPLVTIRNDGDVGVAGGPVAIFFQATGQVAVIGEPAGVAAVAMDEMAPVAPDVAPVAEDGVFAVDAEAMDEEAFVAAVDEAIIAAVDEAVNAAVHGAVVEKDENDAFVEIDEVVVDEVVVDEEEGVAVVVQDGMLGAGNGLPAAAGGALGAAGGLMGNGGVINQPNDGAHAGPASSGNQAERGGLRGGNGADIEASMSAEACAVEAGGRCNPEDEEGPSGGVIVANTAPVSEAGSSNAGCSTATNTGQLLPIIRDLPLLRGRNGERKFHILDIFNETVESMHWAFDSSNQRRYARDIYKMMPQIFEYVTKKWENIQDAALHARRVYPIQADVDLHGMIDPTECFLKSVKQPKGKRARGNDATTSGYGENIVENSDSDKENQTGLTQ